MTTTEGVVRPVTERPDRAAVAAGPKRIEPVTLWAALGTAFVLLQLYVFGRWILSGPVRTPTGPTPVPGWMRTEIHVFEAASVMGGLAMAWFFLVRPWRRDRRISPDGLLILAFPLMYWQDIAGNYTQVQALYNSAAINFGSWFGNIPGWLAPNGNQQVEPFVWVLPAYLYMPLGGAMLGGVLMRRLRRRWPTASNLRIVIGCFFAMAAFDLVVEVAWLRMGMYSYTSVIKGFTLFAGHYYQFPIYEAKLFGLAITGWACIRHFRNDKGQTIAELGVERLGLSPRKETGVRFLALVGITNIIFLGLYNIPFQWTGTHANYSPADIATRSYLTNGICGAGSAGPDGVERPCASRDVPIAKRGGAFVGSDGKVHRPAPR